MLLPAVAQKMSIPELEKIKVLDKKKAGILPFGETL